MQLTSWKIKLIWYAIPSIWDGVYRANYQYIDIKLVNQTLGYAIFGQTLLKYPKPIVISKTNDLDFKNTLEIFPLSQNELLIKSEQNPITAIDIFDLNGSICVNKKYINSQKEIKIPVANLFKGFYLINIEYGNNTASIHKYLIR